MEINEKNVWYFYVKFLCQTKLIECKALDENSLEVDEIRLKKVVSGNIFVFRKGQLNVTEVDLKKRFLKY
jgi:hypothetical protein